MFPNVGLIIPKAPLAPQSECKQAPVSPCGVPASSLLVNSSLNMDPAFNQPLKNVNRVLSNGALSSIHWCEIFSKNPFTSASKTYLS